MTAHLSVGRTILFLALVVGAAISRASACYQITVSASPVAVHTPNTSTITAHVTRTGNPVGGHTIQFSVSGQGDPGYLSPETVDTDGNGNAQTTYYSSSAGPRTITARDLDEPVAT